MSWRRWFGKEPKESEAESEAEPDPAERAERFWRRWAAMQPAVAAALGDGAPGRFENALCTAVADIHPDLEFAVEEGNRAMYALVLTGKEDPRLRPYTDAWKAAAPPEDHLWEYHDHVPPVPDPDAVTVNLSGQRIPLGEIRLAVWTDEARRQVDVAVHHPVFAELTEQARTAMTFLPLEAGLGERRAATYLRRVETAVTEPEESISLLELRELVARLAES